jgi:hypothetical protein
MVAGGVKGMLGAFRGYRRVAAPPAWVERLEVGGSFRNTQKGSLTSQTSYNNVAKLLSGCYNQFRLQHTIEG